MQSVHKQTFFIFKFELPSSIGIMAYYSRKGHLQWTCAEMSLITKVRGEMHCKSSLFLMSAWQIYHRQLYTSSKGFEGQLHPTYYCGESERSVLHHSKGLFISLNSSIFRVKSLNCNWKECLDRIFDKHNHCLPGIITGSSNSTKPVFILLCNDFKH